MKYPIGRETRPVTAMAAPKRINARPKDEALIASDGPLQPSNGLGGSETRRLVTVVGPSHVRARNVGAVDRTCCGSSRTAPTSHRATSRTATAMLFRLSSAGWNRRLPDQRQVTAVIFSSGRRSTALIKR